MPELPEIRPARADDLEAIVDLLADDPLGRTRERPERPLAAGYRDAFAAIDRDPNQVLVVADRGGAIVGVAQLTFIPGLTYVGGERAQVEGVRVAAAERGAGLGRRLLEWTIDAARTRGCRLIQLTTDKERPEARRFYEGLGFTASHEGMKLRL